MDNNRPSPELWHADKADALTTLRVPLNDWQATAISLTRDQLQAIVNAAATQYGITPTVCTCYPGGFTPDAFEGPREDCPEHGITPHDGQPSNGASTDDLDQIRANHQITTNRVRRGEWSEDIAGCTCGARFGWYDRETEHARHVDEQIIARFTR